ncbi:MAG: tRNA dihydrouridine synthase DusB [Rhabdochlamydiaceae bacterium]|nr:tRNA dihydrouridine synthase DusB [Candidatus Amphrikana amoebophyrae]
MEKEYIKPIKLGNLELPNNVFYSPLAGCSDLPFRSICKLFSPGLIFCEMVKMDALVRHDVNTYQILEYSHSMHPIGGQLVGSKLEYAAQSAKIIEDLGFDVVDLNCGCPVDKVTKDKSGSGLLLHPELIGDILNEMVNAVSIPVTVKIRAGWDESQIVAPQITTIAEEAGAKMISIHGRTRKQGYKGFADWDVIAQCKAKAKSIIVTANGDIFSPEAAKRCFDQTGCDAVLASRATMGKPWIAEDIIRYLKGQPAMLRDGGFIKEILTHHFALIIATQTPRKAITDIRRVGCWYLKDANNAKNLRHQLNKMQSLEELDDILMAFPWHELGEPQKVLI